MSTEKERELFEERLRKLESLLKKDEIPEKDFAQFAKFFDIGDFVELSGGLMETKRGEKTLLVSSYRMLAKRLRALPDQWHGLTNVEARFRKRYLDLLLSAETRELFVKKAKFWATIREHLLAAGFLEV